MFFILKMNLSEETLIRIPRKYFFAKGLRNIKTIRQRELQAMLGYKPLKEFKTKLKIEVSDEYGWNKVCDSYEKARIFYMLLIMECNQKKIRYKNVI